MKTTTKDNKLTKLQQKNDNKRQQNNRESKKTGEACVCLLRDLRLSAARLHGQFFDVLLFFRVPKCFMSDVLKQL